MNNKSSISSCAVIGPLGLITIGALLTLLFPDKWASFFIIGFAIVISLKFATYYKDIFNPVSLFTMPWLTAYGLYLLYPYSPKIQPRLFLTAHMLIIGSFVCFFSGWSVAMISASKLPREAHRLFTWSRGTTKLAIFFLIILTLIGFTIQFQIAGGFKGLFYAQKYYEAHFWQKGIISKMFMLGCLVEVVLIMYIVNKRFSWFAILMIGILIMLSALTLGRQYLLLSMFLCIVTFNYYKHRFTLKHGMITAIAGVSVLLLVAGLLSWGLVSKTMAQEGAITNPILKQLYWYSSMGFRNINVVIEKLGFCGSGFPKFTLKPIWAILFLENKMGLPESHAAAAKANRMFYEGWGNATYVPPFYRDFGFIGTLFAIFIIAWGVTWWYHRLRYKITPFRVFVYGLFGNGLLLMFFTNKFTQPQLLIFIIQFALLDCVITTMDKLASHWPRQRVRHLRRVVYND